MYLRVWVLSERIVELWSLKPSPRDEPPPEVPSLFASSERAPQTQPQRKIEEQNRICHREADREGIVGTQIPIHDPARLVCEFRCTSTHFSRDRGAKPGCQKCLSNSMKGRPTSSLSRRPAVDFPAPPRPRITTRCTVISSCLNAHTEKGSFNHPIPPWAFHCPVPRHVQGSAASASWP